MPPPMSYEQTTKNGFNLFEVISALQKEIRRGQEENAMHWALELVPQYEKYLWRRLITIVNEDIGIAYPIAILFIPQLRDNFFEFRNSKGQNGSAKLALANAILLMCRAPKTRISDHFKTVVEQERRHGKLLPIPDYALDKHTGRGHKMNRGFEHWLDEGCKLGTPGNVVDPYAERAREFWTKNFIQADDWADSPKGRKNEDQDPEPTLFDT